MTRQEYIDKYWRSYQSFEGGPDRPVHACAAMADMRFSDELAAEVARRGELIAQSQKLATVGMADGSDVVVMSATTLDRLLALARRGSESIGEVLVYSEW